MFKSWRFKENPKSQLDKVVKERFKEIILSKFKEGIRELADDYGVVVEDITVSQDDSYKHSQPPLSFALPTVTFSSMGPK